MGGGQLTIACHNLNGLPLEPEAPKWQHVADLLRHHDICVLIETRATATGAKKFMGHQKQHTHHARHAPKAGQCGQGVMVVVSRRLQPFVSCWRITPASSLIQCVWLKVQGAALGLEGDVLLGGVYIPPATRKRPAEVIRQAMLELTEEITSAQRVTPHVMLLGDFNALIGASPEPYADASPCARQFPPLALPRECSTPPSLNAAGPLFLEAVAACNCILTTGRGACGDDGRPTCRDASRPDHAVLSCGVFAALGSVSFPAYPHQLFDHAPMQLSFTSAVLGGAPPKHRCSTACARESVLRWGADKQQLYAQALSHTLQSQSAQFQADLSAPTEDVEKACTLLTTAVHGAAHEVGMVRTLPCPHREQGARFAPWFSAECRARKRALCRAAGDRGISREEFISLRKGFRASVRACKRAHQCQRASRFLQVMARCKGLAVKRFMEREARHQAPVSAAAWEEHVHSHFCGGVDAQPAEPDPQAPQRASDFTAPSLACFVERVKVALGRLDEGSSAGGDGIPAAFLKHAVLVEQHERTTTRTHVLAPLLARLFHAVFTRGQVPALWREARLTPLHKKDDPTLPANYRLLAISSVMYRLYTSCVREMLTEWCQRQGAMPDHQFGFYPGRSVQQAQFVLRHLVHGRKQWGGRGSKQVWAAFIDFQAAYDHVDRQALWAHLQQSVGVPSQLLKAMQCLYDNDAYVLRDGPTVTPPIHPLKGVKQGCPLSPLLFALFVNDIAQALEPGGVPVGVPLGPDPSLAAHISHIMFADDLTLVEGSRERLQVLVDRLAAYAQRKGLVVNVRKCAVMAWPSPTESQGALEVHYGGQPIPHVSEFKFLGLRIDQQFSMPQAATKLRGAVMAAWRAVLHQAQEHGLRHMPHAMLHLVQTYVFPVAQFSSQVWGPDLLSLRSLYSTPLQKTMIGIYRQLLGVRSTVSTPSLIEEVGAHPLPYYWLKAATTFWVRAHGAGNRLLDAVLSSERELSRVCRGSWLAKLRRFVCDELGCEAWPDVGAGPELEACLDALLARIQADRTSVRHDPRVPSTMHRARASYLYWFSMPLHPNRHTPTLHPYLCAGARMPAALVESMAKLRLSSHALRVETGRSERPSRPYQDRTCLRCAQGAVDDEYHLLFECGATAAIRRAFVDIVPVDVAPRACMRAIMHCPTVQSADGSSASIDYVAARRRALFVHQCLTAADAARTADRLA